MQPESPNRQVETFASRDDLRTSTRSGTSTMTAAQRTRLRQLMVPRISIMGVLTVAFGVAAALFARSWGERGLVLVALFGLPALLCAGAGIHSLIRLLNDERDGKANTTEGPLRLTVNYPNQSAPRVHVEIGKTWYILTVEQQHDLGLQDGLSYRLYTAPRCQVILGADPLK